MTSLQDRESRQTCVSASARRHAGKVLPAFSLMTQADVVPTLGRPLSVSPVHR